jgi:hypothetical protein
MCPREKMTRKKMDMEDTHFIRLVMEAKDLGAKMISLFGYGEPLLDKTIASKVRFCTNAGLQTFITTNASLLDVDVSSALIGAGLTHIRFSMHGYKKAGYEDVHRGLKHGTVTRNIFNFIAMARKKVKTHVTCIPFHGETADDFKKFFDGKPDFMEVWKPHNWASGREYRNGNGRKRMCRRALTGPVQILADGRLTLCCFDYNGSLAFGNTHNASLEYNLSSSLVLEAFRKRHAAQDLSGLICDTCDQRFVYDESPLLYSNEQQDKSINKTSITKFDLEKGGLENGLYENSEVCMSSTG